MISRLLLPSAVRLATYSCVRRSRRIRARQIMYSARLASRLPPRLRRCLTTFPQEASMGATPQTVAQSLRGRRAQALQLVGRLRPRLNGRAACRTQGPDHLHAPVGALGHARGFSGQNRSCGTLGVGGVGLLEVAPRAWPPVLRALHLKHLDPPGPQMAGEPGPVGAGTFYPGAPEGAEILRPAQKPLVTLRRRWHAGLAQASTQMVQDHGHVEVEVRVYAQDHRNLRGVRPFGADRRHVPSSFRCSGQFATRGAAENGRYCEGSRQEGGELL